MTLNSSNTDTHLNQPLGFQCLSEEIASAMCAFDGIRYGKVSLQLEQETKSKKIPLLPGNLVLTEFIDVTNIPKKFFKERVGNYYFSLSI